MNISKLLLTEEEFLKNNGPLSAEIFIGFEAIVTAAAAKALWGLVEQIDEGVHMYDNTNVIFHRRNDGLDVGSLLEQALEAAGIQRPEA